MDLESISKVGTGILALNQLAPHMIVFFDSFIPLNERSRLKIPEDVVKKIRDLPESLDVLDYLLLSGMIVHNSSTGNGACTDYSYSIMDVYKKLAIQNNRKDIIKKIRLAQGGKNGWWEHEWIEFRQNGRFVPFETTYRIPFIFEKNIRDTLKVMRKEFYSPETHSKGKIAYGRTFSGGKFYYPTFRGLFNFGLIGGIVSFIKYKQTPKKTQ